MKQVEVMRASGMPVSIDHIRLWREEFKKEFDKITKKHGKDMLSIQKDAAEVENRLKTKYPVTEAWNMLKTKKAWKEKLDAYGGVISMTTNRETGDLVYVIMDIEWDAVTYADIAV